MENNNQNFINKLEHIDSVRAKRVVPYQLTPSGVAVSEVQPDLNVIIAANSGDANIEYVGKAEPGTATSAASWQIKRLDQTTGLIITYADGDINYDNVWDNRESLSYS